MACSLHTLPIDIVYGILDHLDVYVILISCRNICQRLNAILNAYRRFQVNLKRGLFTKKMDSFFLSIDAHTI